MRVGALNGITTDRHDRDVEGDIRTSMGRETGSLAGGSALVFTTQAIGNVGFLVAALVVARGLGPEGRGTIAFIVVSALVLSRVAGLGLAEATAVFAAQRPLERAGLLSNLLIFALAAGAMLGGAAAGTLLLLGDSAPAGLDHNQILLLFLGTIGLTVDASTESFLLGCGRLRERSIVKASAPWIYALLAVLMLNWDGLTVTRAGSAWALATAAAAIGLLAASVRGIGLAWPVLPVLRESLRFGARAWIGNLATFLNLRADQIVVGVIASQATLGIYAVAVNGSEVLKWFPAALGVALVPALARMQRDDRQEQTLLVFRLLAVGTAASIVVASLLGPGLLPLTFGPAFDASVAPFLWLLPGAFGFAVTTLFSGALLANAHPGRSSAGPVVSLVSVLALDLLLIPDHGAIGAAIASSAGFLVGGTTALLIYRASLPFPWTKLVPRAGSLDLARLR